MQENARYAFDFLTASARTAGYVGCSPNPENIVRGLNAPWGSIGEFYITSPVSGYESLGGGAYGPSNLLELPRTESGNNVNVFVAGTGIDRNVLDEESDIVVFRTVEQPLARMAARQIEAANPIVNLADDMEPFAVDDIVVMADCQQAAVFKVTGVIGDTDQQELVHANGTGLYDNSPTITSKLGIPIPRVMSIAGASYDVNATVGRIESSYFLYCTQYPAE